MTFKDHEDKKDNHKDPESDSSECQKCKLRENHQSFNDDQIKAHMDCFQAKIDNYRED